MEEVKTSKNSEKPKRKPTRRVPIKMTLEVSTAGLSKLRRTDPDRAAEIWQRRITVALAKQAADLTRELDQQSITRISDLRAVSVPRRSLMESVIRPTRLADLAS